MSAYDVIERKAGVHGQRPIYRIYSDSWHDVVLWEDELPVGVSWLNVGETERVIRELLEQIRGERGLSKKGAWDIFWRQRGYPDGDTKPVWWRPGDIVQALQETGEEPEWDSNEKRYRWPRWIAERPEVLEQADDAWELLAGYNEEEGADAVSLDDEGYLAWRGRLRVRSKIARDAGPLTNYSAVRLSEGDERMPSEWREACRRAAMREERALAAAEYEESAGRPLRALRETLDEVEREERECEERLLVLQRKRHLLEIEQGRVEGSWRIEESSAACRYRNLCGKWPRVGQE